LHLTLGRSSAWLPPADPSYPSQAKIAREGSTVFNVPRYYYRATLRRAVRYDSKPSHTGPTFRMQVPGPIGSPPLSLPTGRTSVGNGMNRIDWIGGVTGSYTSHAPPAPGPRPDTLQWIGAVLHCAHLPTTPPRASSSPGRGGIPNRPTGRRNAFHLLPNPHGKHTSARFHRRGLTRQVNPPRRAWLEPCVSPWG